MRLNEISDGRVADTDEKLLIPGVHDVKFW